MLADLSVLVAGSVLVLLGSRRAVVQGVALAQVLRLPPFLVGAALFSLGTDFAEMSNSVVAALAGHGDIAAGDAIGSVFTQGTLILGLLPFVARFPIVPDRAQVLRTCVLTLLGLGLSALLLSDGRLGRLDALLLAAAWLAALRMLAGRGRQPPRSEVRAPASPVRDAALVLFWLALVAAGAVGIVQGISSLAAAWGVPEYVLSFLLASLGTSLPELVLDITAVRRGHADLALGDLLGSCLVDATLVIGIGPLVRPTWVTADVALRGVALAALGILAAAVACARGQLGRRAGTLLLLIYVAAYLVLFGPA